MLVNLYPKHLIIIMSIEISVEHPIAHVHTQNGTFIKRLQLIARPLLMRAKLPTSV